jgi:hypothetical protein
MKKLIIAALLAAVSLNAHALSGTTVGGHFACTTEDYFDDILQFAIAKDYASAEAYQSQGKCVVLKAGLRVTVMDTTWTGKLQFVYQGLKMWTVMEAVTLDR